jgi:1,4-dihydroxy-2-naphthoate octaprenyltransferase
MPVLSVNGFSAASMSSCGRGPLGMIHSFTVVPLRISLLLPVAALPLAVPVVRTVRTRSDGPSLNGALARTGMLQLVFCVLLSTGILTS